jgi:hypothetical protein
MVRTLFVPARTSVKAQAVSLDSSFGSRPEIRFENLIARSDYRRGECPQGVRPRVRARARPTPRPAKRATPMQFGPKQLALLIQCFSVPLRSSDILLGGAQEICIEGICWAEARHVLEGFLRARQGLEVARCGFTEYSASHTGNGRRVQVLHSDFECL